MSISLELFALVSSNECEISDHLDDTLLSRLETTLYCNNECHQYVWDEFHGPLFQKLMNIFEECVNETPFSLEKLRIFFSILNKMRNYCKSRNFKRLEGFSVQ